MPTNPNREVSHGSLFLCVALLIAGYFTYGVVVDRIFGTDPSRPTPARTMADGVDYVEMSPRKMFLVQLLNIAGLGPIFGPILGALYGPSALIWIVIGSIFGGAVHDYFSGDALAAPRGSQHPRRRRPAARQRLQAVHAPLLHRPAAAGRGGFRPRSGQAARPTVARCRSWAGWRSSSSTISWPPSCPSTRSSAASTRSSAPC